MRKMSVDNAILFTTLLILSSSNIVLNTFAECNTGSCSCDLANGEGYDLSKITGPKDEFIVSSTIFNRTFYFHPCSNKVPEYPGKNFVGCSEKPGVSLCLHNATDNTSQSFGTFTESIITISQPDDLPSLIFRHVLPNKTQATVTIELVCRQGAKEGTVLTEDQNESGGPNYTLMLVSHQACKKFMHSVGLSTGSVLVIIFFVFSGLYFAGGALTLKLLRGATGWEMLPNHKFWFDLPALVRDGIAFTFNGCKVVSYDQI